MLLPMLDRQQQLSSKLLQLTAEREDNIGEAAKPSDPPKVGHTVLSTLLSSLLLFSATPSLAITNAPIFSLPYQPTKLGIAAADPASLSSLPVPFASTTRRPMPSPLPTAPTTTMTAPDLMASFLLLWDEPKTGFAASYSQATLNARDQLRKQQALQDERLSQCEASGDQFEQCFFYGTLPAAPESKTTSATTAGQRATPFLPPPREIIPAESTTANNQKTKGGIPTW